MTGYIAAGVCLVVAVYFAVRSPSPLMHWDRRAGFRTRSIVLSAALAVLAALLILDGVGVSRG